MSDKLSPILVKELRQGMRARVFEGSFLTLQALMVFTMVIAVGAAAAEKHDVSKGFGDAFFWVMVGLLLLLIMPIRGASAIRPEIDNRALELVFLTRLSARRIVAGKWAALFCQTCLLVCAILPYAVLRYYLGNVDVARDFMIILGMLAASALLTALTVSISAFPSRLARGTALVFPILFLYLGPMMIMPFMYYSGSTGVSVSSATSPSLSAGFLLVVVYVVLVTIYILEVGAARIAPPAENHAIAKRVIGLAVLALGPLGIVMGADDDILLVNLALLTPICVDALCTPARDVPGVLLPFFRRKGGRWAAPFLIPGWPSGMLYTGAVLLVSCGLLSGWGLLSDPDVSLAVLSLAASLLMPVALILLVNPRVQRFGTAYIALQLGFLIFTGVFLMLNEAFKWNLEDMLCVLPVSTLVLTLVGEADHSWQLPTALILGVSLLVGASRSRGAFRRFSATYARAAALEGAITES